MAAAVPRPRSDGPLTRAAAILRAAALVLALALAAGPASAQSRPGQAGAATPAVAETVASVTITVRDMDRAVAFYADVLTFEKLSDVEVWGEPYERLTGLFGVRMRVVRMRLGDEVVELLEIMTPRGRPIPIDSRSNDRWFQHVAIVVADMEAAFARLRASKITYAPPAPQRLLEYLSPRDGRPMPPDTRVNDLWHWQINLLTGAGGAAAATLRASGARLVSPAPVTLPDPGLGYRDGLLTRGPDGHGLLFQSR